ncbi:MAG: hypothetical protein M1541_17220, partial [Acidobacteria bacterium]|nr:hypothetical protein [Acidobacteriota bacterium]
EARGRGFVQDVGRAGEARVRVEVAPARTGRRSIRSFHLYSLRAFALLSVGLPLWAQYAGPAILSRGEAPTAMRGAPITFRPFLDIMGVYDTGLTGVSVRNNEGDLAQDSSLGVEASAGVSGSHAWRRTTVGLDYRGSVRHYTRKTYYDGTDHAFGLGLTHQMSRRVMFSLRESAGMFSRDFGLIGGLRSTVPFDPVSSYLPSTDFFDNRTLYMSSQADFTYQKSARLSFNGGGDIFAARRRSQALYGVTGASARGDMQYRVARYTTIGATYSFAHYDFSKGFGGSDIHTIAATYAHRLTRRLEFSGYGGAFRSETKFIQAVQIDPVIAAIIGVSSGIRVVHRIDTAPAGGARLSYSFRRAVASVGYSRGTTPGNGLFLTSQTSTVDGQLTYNGFKRWSAGLSGGYRSNKVISNVDGNYSGYSGSATLARRLIPAVHFRASFYVQQYDSGSFSRYNRLIYRGTVGFSFSPGDLPVRIW